MDFNRRTDTWRLEDTTTRLVVLGDPHGDLAGVEGVVSREAGPATAFVSVGDNVGYANGPTSSELCRRMIARGVRSVYGNHEAWMGGDGTLFIVTREAEESHQLGQEAFAWCRSLPLRLRVSLDAVPELSVSVVHTLVEPDDAPTWEFVKADNADLVADGESVDVVFIGHSHGPAIYTFAKGGLSRCLRLGLEEEEEVGVGVERGKRYVVDAGSLAFPGYHPDPSRGELGSYAVLDVASRRLSLKALKK